MDHVPAKLAGRRSRALDVAEFVADTIKARDLSPGDRIATANELQATLGVAKSTVAEAVKILVDRGHVVAKTGPSGGMFVAPAGSGLKRYFLALDGRTEQAREVMVVRDHLEELVVRAALTDATDDDIAQIGEIVDAMSAATPQDLLPLVWVFHRRVGAAVRNGVLRELYLGLTEYLSGSMIGGFDILADDPAAFAHERYTIHRDIHRSLQQRDASALDDALRRHST